MFSQKALLPTIGKHLGLLSLTSVIPLETVENYDFQLKHVSHSLSLALYAFDSQAVTTITVSCLCT